MIISDEQARLAADYLRAHGPDGRGDAVSGEVPSELVERVRDSVAHLPELRADRVSEARALLSDQPSADEVAGKMLGRLICDSLR